MNHLALKAQVKYRDTDVRIPALNGPAFQSLLCKLKTTLDDYEQASLLHPRVASGGTITKEPDYPKGVSQC